MFFAATMLAGLWKSGEGGMCSIVLLHKVRKIFHLAVWVERLTLEFLEKSDCRLLSAFQILDTSILRYRAHESPNNNINAVHICATSLIDAGTYVPEDAYYKGDWPGGGPRTSVTGKNIAVWKRK
jgi:hypothetical protein